MFSLARFGQVADVRRLLVWSPDELRHQIGCSRRRCWSRRIALSRQRGLQLPVIDTREGGLQPADMPDRMLLPADDPALILYYVKWRLLI